MPRHLAGLLLTAFLACADAAEIIEGRVDAVVDGRTVSVMATDQKQHAVRLIALDTPENEQPYASASKDNLSRLVLDKTARVEVIASDESGPLVGKIWVAPADCLTCGQTLDAGMAQLTRGLAWWSLESSNGLSEEDRGRYEFAEHEAKARRAGLWAQSNPVPPWKWRSGTRETKPHWQTFAYHCEEDYHFVVRIEGETIWLFRPRQTVSLPHISSASGAKYSDGTVTFWAKGEQAVLETRQKTHRDCNNNRYIAIWEDAKLRGVDFRATGNEPGWHLELRAGGYSAFVGDYGERRIEFATPEPVVTQAERITTYTAHSGGHFVRTTIEGRACIDSMSGDQFEATVTVEVDNKLYRGCGRALH